MDSLGSDVVVNGLGLAQVALVCDWILHSLVVVRDIVLLEAYLGGVSQRRTFNGLPDSNQVTAFDLMVVVREVLDALRVVLESDLVIVVLVWR